MTTHSPLRMTDTMLPLTLEAYLQMASSVGIGGSREPSVDSVYLVHRLIDYLRRTTDVPVITGDARGIDAIAADRFRDGRGTVLAVNKTLASARGYAYALISRTVAVVERVAATPGSVWVAFPDKPMPVTRFMDPHPDNTRYPLTCFTGNGGTWGATLYAASLGLRCIVGLPEPMTLPHTEAWPFEDHGGGWWSVHVRPPVIAPKQQGFLL
jgi:hypothetical protein